jgi:zinc D-Ala-D-Ala carboxypeptidase
MLNAPLVINSGHRCALHNARVGGAPLSLHKRLAFDVALSGHDPPLLATAAKGVRLSRLRLRPKVSSPRHPRPSRALVLWQGQSADVGLVCDEQRIANGK